MKKRTIAFYDLLIYAIISGPLIICAVLILIFGKINDLEWTIQNWYLVLLLAIGIIFPIGGSFFVRYYIMINDRTIYFYYMPFKKSIIESANNIDIRWNQNVYISEVKNVEIVRLTEEEKRTKVFHKHCINKYLKINLKNGNPKYVYIGNYAQCQIKKIIKILENKNF